MSLVLLQLLTALAAAPTPAEPPTDRVAGYVWPDGEAPAPFDAAPTAKASWVIHTVLPHEQLEEVAARYGVSVRSIVKGNKLDPPKIRARQKLRIYARRTPPPRERRTYRSQPGDTWVSVSVAHQVRYRALRAWNWQQRGDLKPNRDLLLFVEPGPTRTVYEAPGPPLPEISVPAGGESVGKPSRGELEGGVRIPDTALFDLRWPEDSWGSTHAVRTVMAAAAGFRHDSGYAGRLVLGALSRWRGRRFPPHKSHRSGRDIDVYLPLADGIPFTWHPDEHQIDWPAAWALAVAFLQTGEVEAIYLDRALHRYLFEAGRHLGASPELLAAVVEWPKGDGPRRGVPVRHGEDHTRHFHIRLRCSPEEARCVTMRWADRVPRDYPWPASWGNASPDPWKVPVAD